LGELAAALRPGDDATFVVSDDRMQLSGSRPESGNALEATVLAEEFVGATAVVHLEGAGGQELRAQKSHDELARLTLSPGDKVWMSWSPEAAHVLPGR
jgi:spermidine/putrescine transport system ATP-binding protein